MPIRRVVAARDAAGRSVVVSDGPAPREAVLQHTPGFVVAPIWLEAATPTLPGTGDDVLPLGGTLLPGPGGAVFMVVTFPPDSVMARPEFRPDLSGAEFAAATPGIAECFEVDDPGMHTTPTVDYAIVLSGNLSLRLDDGVLVPLGAGDTVVQHGTRHGWSNPTDQPATVAFVLTGARAE